MAVKHPVFKPYNQQQMLAIPPTLEELIPREHPVRVVNEVINKLNIEPLLKAYHIKGSYGSEENYTLLEQKEITPFVKYDMFDKEQNGNYRSKYPFAAEKLFYTKILTCKINKKKPKKRDRIICILIRPLSRLAICRN